MTLLPRHKFSRIAAALWLLASIAFLLLTLAQPDLYDNNHTARSVLVALYFLAFPLGHLAVIAASKIKLWLYLSFNYSPDILPECLFLWTLMTLLGYLQWFVLLPWLSRLCWKCCVALSGKQRESTNVRPNPEKPID